MERYLTETSSFRSGMEWQGLSPPLEHATGELTPLFDYIPGVVGLAAAAVEIAPKCESPIEIELGARLLNTFRLLNSDGLRLFSQYLIEPFRYDFGIVLRERLIALVECDGRDFHWSEDQKKNDRVKEKVAAQLGVRFFRFSGALIYENSKECVRRILNEILKRNDLTPRQWEILHETLKPRPTFIDPED
jgi:very-short-patch-repair endonuclease